MASRRHLLPEFHFGCASDHFEYRLAVERSSGQQGGRGRFHHLPMEVDQTFSLQTQQLKIRFAFSIGATNPIQQAVSVLAIRLRDG